MNSYRNDWHAENELRSGVYDEQSGRKCIHNDFVTRIIICL